MTMISLVFQNYRKRRKIETESFHRRVLERNISNPLAIHKLHPSGGGGTLRRSNKIRQVMNITSPMSPNGGLTPVDPMTPNNRNGVGRLSARHKNVTWSPKVCLKNGTPTPPARSEATRVTTIKSYHGNGLINGNGLELDPDTSVTPLETYRSHVNMNGNGRHANNSSHSPSDTMHSNNSLTLYF